MTTDDRDTEASAEAEGPWAEVYPNPPRELLASVEKRMDGYFRDLCDGMRVAPTERLRRAMLAVAGQYHHAELMRSRSATRAQRKKRVHDKLEHLRAGLPATRGLIDSMFDDWEWQQAGLGEVIIPYFKAMNNLKRWLEDEAARLGPPNKGDRTSVITPAKQLFVSSADQLWRLEAHEDRRDSKRDREDWSTLLFEVATGEPDRSLSKARRDLAENERAAVTPDAQKS